MILFLVQIFLFHKSLNVICYLCCRIMFLFVGLLNHFIENDHEVFSNTFLLSFPLNFVLMIFQNSYNICVDSANLNLLLVNWQIILLYNTDWIIFIAWVLLQRNWCLLKHLYIFSFILLQRILLSKNRSTLL